MSSTEIKIEVIYSGFEFHNVPEVVSKRCPGMATAFSNFIVSFIKDISFGQGLEAVNFNHPKHN
jgi:C4-dicarboxylate transporter